jgi:SOS-response transcriptional repressor LexA
MPRPSRIVEAKEKLRAHHAEHGLMPSLTALAELMGLRGASSVQELAAELVQNGFLAREGRAGRLIPGPAFVVTAQRAHRLPPELAAALPPGVELKVVRVAVDSMAPDGVMRGDFLMLAPAERADLSKTLLLAQGRARALAESPPTGWKVLGVVVAQFRSYL